MLDKEIPYRFQLKEEHMYKLRWLLREEQIKDVTEEIGEGGQGSVYLASFKAKHQQREPLSVALKILLVDGYVGDQWKRSALQNARRQIQIISKIAHCPPQSKPPNIVEFYRAREVEGSDSNTINYKAFIIMERAEFDLSRLKDKPIQMRLELCLDACTSLRDLHNLNIAHRDVKPTNFLVFKVGRHYIVKLSDFGCARLYNDTCVVEDMTATGAIGSGNYRPPEVIMPTYQGKDFRCQDIWSFCLTLLEILFGFPVESRVFSNFLSSIFNNPHHHRDIAYNDIVALMEGKLDLQQFAGAQELFLLILEGLRFRVQDRVGNLNKLQSCLSRYRGYQKKYCRFSNSRYRLELRLLPLAETQINNIIEDVTEEVVAQDQHGNDVILRAIYKLGVIKKNALMRIVRVSESNPAGTNYLRKAMQNFNFIADTFQQNLLTIYEKCSEYKWKGQCLSFFLYENGQILSLKKLYRGFDIENRLGICNRILDSIIFLHRKKFAIRGISMDNILLVKKGLRYCPKILNYDMGEPNCTDTQLFQKDLSAFLLLVLQLITGRQQLDSVQSLSQLTKANCDEILIAFNNAHPSQKINTMANLLLVSLNSQDPTADILLKLQAEFKSFSQALPSTFQGTSLSKLFKYEPHLINMVIEADRINDKEFRVLYNHSGKEIHARLTIYDLRSMDETKQLMVQREIVMANYLLGNHQGFLTYYNSVFNHQAGYAYLITQDYTLRCTNITDLRKQLLVSPNQIIVDFKNIIIGLSALHSVDIAHMDVVPSNIYLTNRDRVNSLKLGGFEKWIRGPTDKVLLNRSTETEYKPPEFFFNSSYDTSLRFASDVWMVGTCIIAFLCGVETLKPINELLKEFHNRPPKFHAYYQSRRADTSEQLRAKKFRKQLLLMNVAQRSSKTHLSTFLDSYYTASTMQSGIPTSLIRQQSLSKDFDYKFQLGINIEKYCSFLQYILTNQQQFFIWFLRSVSERTREEVTRSHTQMPSQMGFIDSLSISNYMQLVSGWLYILGFLQTRLLKDCQDIAHRNESSSQQLSFVIDNKKRVEELLIKAALRTKNNHSYLQRADSGIVQTLQQINVDADRMWERLFKPKLLFQIKVVRDYVLSIFSEFTVAENEFLKGIILGHDIACYVRNPAAFPDIMEYSQLAQVSTQNLIDIFVAKRNS